MPFIMKEICLKSGVPKYVSTDQGKEFNDKTFALFTEIYNKGQIKTSRYSPRANGEIERR